MAITGLIIVAFLLMHMFGNTKLLVPDNGAEFDEYSHALRTFMYPILPEYFFLTLFRIALGLSALIHMIAAIQLTLRDRKARGNLGRYVKAQYQGGNFAARTMIWGGIIILGGLVLHLLQFTAEVIRVNYPNAAMTVDPHLRVVYGFREWWLVAAYAIWMLAVCIHIYHGFYSAFCTLGARVGAFSEKVLKICGTIVAVLLYIGFMTAPVLIFAGVIFNNV